MDSDKIRTKEILRKTLSVMSSEEEISIWIEKQKKYNSTWRLSFEVELGKLCKLWTV